MKRMTININALLLSLVLLSACGTQSSELKQTSPYDLWISKEGLVIRFVDDQPILLYKNLKFPLQINSNSEFRLNGYDGAEVIISYQLTDYHLKLHITSEGGAFNRLVKKRNFKLINYKDDVELVKADSATVHYQREELRKVIFSEADFASPELKKDLALVRNQSLENYNLGQGHDLYIELYGYDYQLRRSYTGLIPNALVFPKEYLVEKR